MTSPAAARSRTFILAAIFAGAVLTGARLVHRGLADATLTAANGSQLFDNVKGRLARDYVDTLSDSSLYRMAVDGLMKELNDPENAFLPSREHPTRAKEAHTTKSSIGRALILPDAIGYVGIQAFTGTTSRDLTRTVDSLLHHGAHALVIDVRASSSDSLQPGIETSDLFLNPGQEVVRTKGRIADSAHSYANQGVQRWPTLPIAVLVNRQTASAAELFAGALQDHDRAVIVGAPTAGRGGSQTLYPVDSAGTLRLTTARWFTPSGRSIAKVPLESDALDGSDPAAKNPTYKTDAGRTIAGGGGIMPDVIAGDTVVHRRASAKRRVAPPPAEDTILVTAQHLLAGARSPAQALKRATQIAVHQKPSP